MKNTKKTRLEAFKEAQEAGQIAITIETSAFFTELLKLDDCYWHVIESLTSKYDPKDHDGISDEFFKLYKPLYDGLIKGWVDYVLSENLGNAENFIGI